VINSNFAVARQNLVSSDDNENVAIAHSNNETVKQNK